MSNWMSARIGALVAGAALLSGPVAWAQEHVRLMPQLGMDIIGSLAFSRDGRYVLTGSWDGSAHLWDVKTGEQIRRFAVHTDRAIDEVTSVAFSPDGRTILIGSQDKTPRLWDVMSGQELRSLQGHTEQVSSVAFSPDGRTVLTGSEDKTARLWDAATGKQIASFARHPNSVTSVAFSPDGRFVLTGCWDGTARLWDVKTQEQIRSFAEHTQRIRSVAFSSDGRFVLTGSRDGTARIWNAATGEQIRILKGHSDEVDSVAFSPDARLALTGSDDKTVRLWDAATGQQIRSFGGEEGWVQAVAFSPDGRCVLAGNNDGRARLFDIETGRRILTFEGHTDRVFAGAFSEDGRLLVTGSMDKTARLWDLGTGQQIRSLEGNGSSVISVALSADGRFVLTGGNDKSARLWDVRSGEQIRSLEGQAGPVFSVAFSPDGHLVLTGSEDNKAPAEDQTAQLRDVATGKAVRSFAGKDVYSAAFSPDGRWVLTGGIDHEARLWDAATGERIRSYVGHTDEIDSVAISPDGRLVLTGSMDKTARLWELATGRQIRSFATNEGIRAVTFSPDGRAVLAGGWDNAAHLWDVSDGKEIVSFEGHSGAVNSVAFSPDGRLVLTGSDDTTTRLWDTASGKQLATLLSFDHGGWAVTDAEGRYDANDPDYTPGLVWATESNRVIELKQLKDNYYTPNLLARLIKGERLPAVKGLDLVPAPPAVTIASPYRPENKRLALSIADQGGGVGKLVVSVNDRKVAVLEHPVEQAINKTIKVRKSSIGGTDVIVDLSAATLKPGENTVSAYAFDSDNQIRSHEAVASFSVAAKSKGLTPEPGDSMSTDYKPQFYGIVVGTSRFGDHSMDLLYPAHDAESMTIGLEIGADHLFGKENVHLRLLTTDAKEEGGQPTKKNIAAVFAEVMQRAKPTDVLLVYLSGHGVNLRTEKDSYYYLTTDARSLEIENNPALRQLSTVSSAELRQWLSARNMPLKEVLILDTCAAGAANEELLKLVEKRDVPPDQRRAVEFLKDATGTVILMGAAADKVSYEASMYGQGLLTYALLEGMRGRSVDAGSQLNVSRWFQNASEEVPLLAQSIGGIQKPVIAAPSGTGFPVALLNAADQARIPLEAIKPELLHLSCHDDDDEDPLGLAQAVREQLREISQPSVRGREAEPPIVYFDDMNDGPTDSLTPKIVYSVQGDTVSMRLRIDQAGKTVKEERLNLSNADKNALATSVAAKLVTMAAQISPEGAKR